MLLSKSCEYGIRASLYLAVHGRPGEYVSIGDVSRELGISFHFLTKILQTLTQAGLMQSFRGPRGGVALARQADRITLKEIVLALDGPGIFRECVLGLPGCGDRKPCPLHDQWAATRHQVHQMFAAATLAEVAERIQTSDCRIADFTPV
jgi:Rrf2 family transcriptional regulator, iron-sulfur cluster assembly transcription factor